jgi:hypothetical protein
MDATTLNGSWQQRIAQILEEPDHHHEVALGRRTGETLWNKFGYNSSFGPGTEVVASFGGTFTPLLTASTLSFVSTSGNDTNGGTGCHGLVVYGVDENRDNQIEVVFLTGVTPVVTTSQWLGINRIAIFRSGTSLINEGQITGTATTDASIQTRMEIGEGTSQQCIFFTNAGSTGLFNWLTVNALKISAGTEPVITVKAWVYSAVSNAKYEVFRISMDTKVTNNIELSPDMPFVLGEQSAFWLEATTDKASTEISARFSLIEYDAI